MPYRINKTSRIAIPITKPLFIEDRNEYWLPIFSHGDLCCCPIPRDVPNIVSPDFPSIKATLDLKYDGSLDAQRLLKGMDQNHCGNVTQRLFTRISVPFSASDIEGAYICINGFDYLERIPTYLKFTFTSSTGVKTTRRFKFLNDKTKKLRFDILEDFLWYKLPIYLTGVVLCDISKKKEEGFRIASLSFFRKETPEESVIRKSKETLWSEAPVVKPKFLQEAKAEKCIPLDNANLIKPLLSMVKCKDDSRGKESGSYDQVSKAQSMLKGEYGISNYVRLSHLSIPFMMPCSIKGALICGGKFFSSPSLLLTFTDCDGEKTSKKYEFSRPKYFYEWHFLPIDLPNVILCEIEGKGTWNNKNRRCFNIHSLIFKRQGESEIIERLSLLPWK
ncbi:hypothetical protein ADUPG1_006404 [Aduncisulcus paluster]|uniref:LAGLIDADG homing endonuclease n=1 Tax=Aduncisulcus paluster TaxID=2918883 RepID=A0ABQ5KL47_9EUKA|nr:hypothetical protein ADUPG1_006404 [Aduncisulcus paluster]